MVPPDTLWTCPKCRCPNGAARAKCLLCGTAAPVDAAPQPAGGTTSPPAPPQAAPRARPAPVARTPAPPPEAPPAPPWIPTLEVSSPPPPAPRSPLEEPDEPVIPRRLPTIPKDLHARPLPSASGPGRLPEHHGTPRVPAGPSRGEAGLYPSGPAVPPAPLADAETACPVCRLPLKVAAESDAKTLDCDTCGGRWLDADQAHAALGPLPPPLEPGQRAVVRARFPWSPAEPPAEGKRLCPRCRTAMHRRPSTPAGPVWIDECLSRHGFWFDRGELERLRAFARAGGFSLPAPPHVHPTQLISEGWQDPSHSQKPIHDPLRYLFYRD